LSRRRCFFLSRRSLRSTLESRHDESARATRTNRGVTHGRWLGPACERRFATHRRGRIAGSRRRIGQRKNMMALALMGLLPAGARVSGAASIEGTASAPTSLVALREPDWRAVRGRQIAMVFQEPMTALNPVMRIGAQIAEA